MLVYIINWNKLQKKGQEFDLTHLFDQTLLKNNPMQAVTFVDNHDSQPNQSLESFVEPWFKAIAYGIILLRQEGYPVLFYGDYYGIQGDHPIEPQREVIDKLMYLKKNFAYGDQTDYLDHGNCIGWTRSGNEECPKGCAIVISNSEAGYKDMFVGKEKKGFVYEDYLGNCTETVTIDEAGNGHFLVEAGSISVWVNKEE